MQNRLNKTVAQVEHDSSFSATTIAALLFLAAKFPHRQFNSASYACFRASAARRCRRSRTPPTRHFRSENARYSDSTLGLPSIRDLSNNDRWLGGMYMAKGVRKSITIPGLLAPTVKQRCAEFGHSIFTPYAVELVCYDLRSDAKHSITLEIARDTQPAQDAVDRELVARYRPGQPRKGLLVQLVERIHHLQSVAAASRHDLPLPPLSAVAERVTFPFDIWRLVDVRWQELGYRSFSAYITGLIRYDLLVGGPHSSTTADCRSKLQRKLTRKTLADRRKGRRRKILLDHLIEETEGRPIPEEELERVKASIAKELRRISFSQEARRCLRIATAFQREPIRTSSRGASTVKVERSAASNTFTARSER